jgi:3-isopropylmalate dehydrogenase
MTHTIAVFPGDGVGPEVISQGMKVIDALQDLQGFEVEWVLYDNGATKYRETGELLSEETLREIEHHCEAIYLGALGDPRVTPGVLEKGILLTLRFYFDQYINLRPIRLLDGVECPLTHKTSKDIDFTVVRENTEDFYVGIGQRVPTGKCNHDLTISRSLFNIAFRLDVETEGSEIAYQVGVISRKGAERIVRYAFDRAQAHHMKTVHFVDKANVLSDMYGLWRETVQSVGDAYPGISYEFMYVDAAAMHIIRNPEWFSIMVTPNMFGDILTDLGAMIQGGLGLAPGGNLNPQRISMFEPIHGSAPDIAGQNRVNPLATIWAGALMLGEIGENNAQEYIINAIEAVLREKKVRTQDLGGVNTTSEMGDAIVSKIRQLEEKELK